MKVNREIDCVILNEVLFIVVNELVQDIVFGIFGCDLIENKLVFFLFVFFFLFEMLQFFDNQLLIIKVFGLCDEFGNFFFLFRNVQGIVQEILDVNGNIILAIDIFKWDFWVVVRDIFVQDIFLEIMIYQDSEGIFNMVLFNIN